MISWFPDPYPDELFYSACARFKASMQYPHYRTVARVLFGEEQIGATVDFPCHLGYLVQQLPPGSQYTVGFLIAQYTLLPFYQPFLPADRVQEIRRKMIVGPGKGIHGQSGMTGSDVTPPAFLRYCPVCVNAERATLGECYWHRLHQAPGVIVCPRHEVFLEDSPIRTTTALRTNTYFAADESISDTMPRSTMASPFFQTYTRLALSIDELLKASLPCPEKAFWSNQYMALMAQRGYITPRGRFRGAEFRQLFLQTYPLELLQQLGCHIKLETKAWDAWWAGLRGAHRAMQHPLFHLLVLQMLEVSVTNFFHQRYAPPAVFGLGPWPCLNPVCRHYRQAIITSFQLSKNSHTRQPVGRFTCPCGFSYSRSGMVPPSDGGDTSFTVIAYGEVWENHLRELWGNPMLSQQEISRRLGVAFETINRQAKHLGLPMPRLSQWKSSHPSGVLHPRRGKDKAWYRQQWLALLKAHPEASRTHLCRFLPGVHSWLTRHDRAWLDQHLPPPRLQQRIERSEPPSAGTPRIRKFRHEGLEDAELAVRVKATAQQFRSEAERLARITKRRLLLAIPALTVLRSAQHRFPLTAQAVEACQETHEGFGLRKVCWATQRYAEEQVYPTRYQFEVRAGVLAVCEHPLIRQAVDDALRELEPLKGYGLALAAV